MMRNTFGVCASGVVMRERVLPPQTIWLTRHRQAAGNHTMTAIITAARTQLAISMAISTACRRHWHPSSEPVASCAGTMPIPSTTAPTKDIRRRSGKTVDGLPRVPRVHYTMHMLRSQTSTRADVAALYSCTWGVRAGSEAASGDLLPANPDVGSNVGRSRSRTDGSGRSMSHRGMCGPDTRRASR